MLDCYPFLDRKSKNKLSNMEILIGIWWSIILELIIQIDIMVIEFNAVSLK